MDCIARMNEFEWEIEPFSDSIKRDPGTATSIRGVALSDPSLLFINYVKPEFLSKLWQCPWTSLDVDKAFPDLDDYINDYLEDIDSNESKDPSAWQAHFRSLDVFQAFDIAVERVLFHHPGRSWEENGVYDVLK